MSTMISEYLQCEGGYRGSAMQRWHPAPKPEVRTEDDVEPVSIQERLQHADSAVLQ